MSNQLKDLYSQDFYDRFSGILKKILPDFNKRSFIQLIFDKEWETRELKDRLWHTSRVLNQFFPANFDEAGSLIIKTVEALRQDGFTHASLEFMFLPDYVERFGLNHFDSAVKVFECITSFTSCEFAVRPFIIKYPDEMMAIMLKWSKHPDKHVRRLASEGSRSRLPWAMALPEFKKDPSPVLPILGNLNRDKSEYVRRSVANNLNDISKDNPDITLSVCKRWYGKNDETNRLVKHACRTLLKQGDKRALQLFGYGSPADVEVLDFQVNTPEVSIGDDLLFSFQLKNAGKSPQKMRLEYGLYYKKSNGSLSRKVFKISEKILDVGINYDFLRKQSFRLITTRKFYPGVHEISIIVNGEEKAKKIFDLKSMKV